jgi:hypothetical protein
MEILWAEFAKGIGTIGPVGVFALVGWVAWLKYGRPPLTVGSSTKTTTTEVRPMPPSCMSEEIVAGVRSAGEPERHQIREILVTAERIDHRQEGFNATSATTAACLERVVTTLERIEGNLAVAAAAYVRPPPRRRHGETPARRRPRR